MTDHAGPNQAGDELLRKSRELEQCVAELTHTQERLRELAAELTLAGHRERRRFATDVRDHLAQLLAFTTIKVRQAAGETKSRKLQEILQEARTSLDESLRYIRNLVAELCPPVLHDFGLLDALRWLAKQMEGRGLRVDVHIEQKVLPLPEDRKVLLFESVHELLKNVQRHARSDRVRLSVVHQEEELRIAVKDHGTGFDPASVMTNASSACARPAGKRFGLLSIRERMKLIGGTFEVSSAPGDGTCVVLALPLRQPGARGPGLPGADDVTVEQPT